MLKFDQSCSIASFELLIILQKGIFKSSSQLQNHIQNCQSKIN